MLPPNNSSGYSAEWLCIRSLCKIIRKWFTSVLARHGVRGRGYGICSNAISHGLQGASVKTLRKLKGLDQNANVRDHASFAELVAWALAEILGGVRILKQNCYGNDQCADVCYDTAKHVAQMADALLGNSTSEAP